jgi:hypothetical protein
VPVCFFYWVYGERGLTLRGIFPLPPDLVMHRERDGENEGWRVGGHEGMRE